jgi:hypothetical protein
MVFQQWEKKGEKLWNGGVSAVGKNGERLRTVVFRQWGKCEKMLNSGVSAMGNCGELLNSGVSAMGKLVSS